MNSAEATLPVDGAEQAVATDDAGAPAMQLTEKEAADLERLLQLRLSPDNMLLELHILPGSGHHSLQARLQSVLQRCAALGITPAPDDALLRRLLAKGKEKQWLTLAAGLPAVAPVQPVLDLLIPSVPPAVKDRFRERAYVRKGDVIARVHPGSDGTPGHDLKGKVLPSGPARQITLPMGAHTMQADDEAVPTLVAECDGMISFDHMRFNVQPMQLVTVGMPVRGTTLKTVQPVFAPGSMPYGTTVISDGDIYIAGDVDESNIISTGGSVTVLGCVTGHYQKHCRVEAKGDVMLASAIHVDVKSGQDVYIQTQARDATIAAVRNLFLLTRLRSALYDVNLEVDGVVVPFDAPTSPADVTPDERHTFNVECQIPAQLGIWEGTTLVFHDCRVAELSVAAASIVFPDMPPIPANKIVHLKFLLPGSSPIQILARTLPASSDGKTIAGFRQISHQDEVAITTYCLAIARLRVVTGVVGEPAEQFI